MRHPLLPHLLTASSPVFFPALLLPILVFQFDVFLSPSPAVSLFLLMAFPLCFIPYFHPSLLYSFLACLGLTPPLYDCLLPSFLRLFLSPFTSLRLHLLLPLHLLFLTPAPPVRSLLQYPLCQPSSSHPPGPSHASLFHPSFPSIFPLLQFLFAFQLSLILPAPRTSILPLFFFACPLISLYLLYLSLFLQSS